jgi:hypothetical protein
MTGRITRRRKPLVAAGCGIALALGAGGARADSSGMDWLGIVYLWAADISVDTRDVNLDVDFSDTIDKLEMGFQGRVEAQGDDFGGFVDVSFMGVGNNNNLPNVHLSSDLDMTAIDLAMVWSPGPERSRGSRRMAACATSIPISISSFDPEPPALPTVETGINTTYTDFLLGARYGMPLNEHWRLGFGGDLRKARTEGTWSLYAFGSYVTGRHHFYVGYKHVEMDLKGSTGESVTETYSGPAIAYGFSF